MRSISREFPLSVIAERLSGPDALKKVALHIKNHQRAIEGLSKAAKNILKDHYEEGVLLYSGLYTCNAFTISARGAAEVSEMYPLLLDSRRHTGTNQRND